MDKKADVSSVSPSSERLEELWVVCGFICRKWSYTIGGNMVTRKKNSVGIKGADLEDKFLF